MDDFETFSEDSDFYGVPEEYAIYCIRHAKREKQGHELADAIRGMIEAKYAASTEE